MIKIEATTLEDAYKNAASALDCSVTELKIEVVQAPSNGVMGLFKKNAIIVAVKDESLSSQTKEEPRKLVKEDEKKEIIAKENIKTGSKKIVKSSKEKIKEKIKSFTPVKSSKEKIKKILNTNAAPVSFVSEQGEENETVQVEKETKVVEEKVPLVQESVKVEKEVPVIKESVKKDNFNIENISLEIKRDINNLFLSSCYDIDEIAVSVYNEQTILIEFKGADVALLIGKEGYRYKALSYMIFNWINSKYKVQLRLEIAEFLKNQEESMDRYLQSVCDIVDKDGRAQTKTLDGVLVQIALKELRDKYVDKYVAIRTTRDGSKYIIINDYHS